MISKVAVVLVGLTVGLLLVAGQEQELAVDISSENGNRIQVPYFSSELTSVEPELRDALVSDTKEVLDLVGKTLIQRIRAKSSVLSSLQGGYAWAKMVKQMATLAHAQEKKRPKSGPKTTEIRKLFNKSMQSMFERIQKKSNQLLAGLKGSPKEPEQLAQEVQIFFSDFVESVQSSPVASYVDWPLGTVNGEPFEDKAAQVMAKLSYYGFGPVFKCFETLLSVLVRLSGSRSSA